MRSIQLSYYIVAYVIISYISRIWHDWVEWPKILSKHKTTESHVKWNSCFSNESFRLFVLFRFWRLVTTVIPFHWSHSAHYFCLCLFPFRFRFGVDCMRQTIRLVRNSIIEFVRRKKMNNLLHSIRQILLRPKYCHTHEHESKNVINILEMKTHLLQFFVANIYIFFVLFSFRLCDDDTKFMLNVREIL